MNLGHFLQPATHFDGVAIFWHYWTIQITVVCQENPLFFSTSIHGHLPTCQLSRHYFFWQVTRVRQVTWDPYYTLGVDCLDRDFLWFSYQDLFTEGSNFILIFEVGRWVSQSNYRFWSLATISEYIARARFWIWQVKKLTMLLALACLRRYFLKVFQRLSKFLYHY